MSLFAFGLARFWLSPFCVTRSSLVRRQVQIEHVPRHVRPAGVGSTKFSMAACVPLKPESGTLVRRLDFIFVKLFLVEPPLVKP
jgi:hypothetical protein